MQRVWCCAVVAAGIVAVGAISLAYGAPTIVTWSHWSVPASLWLTAFAGAPLLFLATARLARVDLGRGASRALLACGAACLLVEACVLAGQWAWLLLGLFRVGGGDKGRMGLGKWSAAFYLAGLSPPACSTLQACSRCVSRSI